MLLLLEGSSEDCAALGTVAAQSGNMDTKARRMSWGGIWNMEQSSAEHFGQNFQFNPEDTN